jgi:hypothetical protein
MKILPLILTLLTMFGCMNVQQIKTPEVPREIVFSDGMKICAKTPLDSICISAVGGNTRSIMWDGEVHSITLIPRKKRWHGLLGLVSPKQPGNLWKSKDGVIRAIVEEAQINYTNVEMAVDGLDFPSVENDYNFVYNDSGLLLIWHKSILPNQKVLDLMIYQILINGEKPQYLPGSRNNDIYIIE